MKRILYLIFLVIISCTKNEEVKTDMIVTGTWTGDWSSNIFENCKIKFVITKTDKYVIGDYYYDNPEFNSSGNFNGILNGNEINFTLESNGPSSKDSFNGIAKVIGDKMNFSFAGIDFNGNNINATGTAILINNVSNININFISPSKLATDVFTNCEICVSFSGFIDTLTVNNSTFFLEDPSGKINAKISCSNGSTNTQLRLKPDHSLTNNTLYKTTISGNIKDLNGKKLSYDHIWSFTTEIAPIYIQDCTIDGLVVYEKGNTLFVQDAKNKSLLVFSTITNQLLHTIPSVSGRISINETFGKVFLVDVIDGMARLQLLMQILIK